MEELIRKENMAVGVSVKDGEDAIRKVAGLLLANGLIGQEYIDNMIDSIREYGPYIVLTRNFALAHAAPCEAVYETSLSMITLKEPVEFGSPNDPVKVMMCLACRDKEEHIAVLQKVARKLMEEGTIEKYWACQDVDELYRLVNE